MKILCVDDEPLALKMLEMSVKKARQRSRAAATLPFSTSTCAE